MAHTCQQNPRKFLKLPCVNWTLRRSLVHSPRPRAALLGTECAWCAQEVARKERLGFRTLGWAGPAAARSALPRSAGNSARRLDIGWGKEKERERERERLPQALGRGSGADGMGAQNHYKMIGNFVQFVFFALGGARGPRNAKKRSAPEKLYVFLLLWAPVRARNAFPASPLRPGAFSAHSPGRGSAVHRRSSLPRRANHCETHMNSKCGGAPNHTLDRSLQILSGATPWPVHWRPMLLLLEPAPLST